MRRGISHSGSGIDELRSRDVAGSHRTPIEDDAAQAASWTTRSVREVTGERTTVHLVLPDMRGRLRVVWREGERVQMGSEATAMRRMAFESLTSSHLEPSSNRVTDRQRWCGFFPLHHGGRPLGVLEVIAPVDVFRNRFAERTHPDHAFLHAAPHVIGCPLGIERRLRDARVVLIPHVGHGGDLRIRHSFTTLIGDFAANRAAI